MKFTSISCAPNLHINFILTHNFILLKNNTYYYSIINKNVSPAIIDVDVDSNGGLSITPLEQNYIIYEGIGYSQSLDCLTKEGDEYFFKVKLPRNSQLSWTSKEVLLDIATKHCKKE